jgi:GcrA cell cycle regulator
MSDWTHEEITTLTRLVGENHSASTIARMMGRGRNSIISKVHRLKGAAGKLNGAPEPGHGERKRAAPKSHNVARRAPRPRMVHAAPKPVFERPQPYVPAVNLPATLPVGFLDAVDRKRCLHFMGDPFGPDGPDAPVCGAERSADAGTVPYCRRHLVSATRAVPA